MNLSCDQKLTKSLTTVKTAVIAIATSNSTTADELQLKLHLLSTITTNYGYLKYIQLTYYFDRYSHKLNDKDEQRYSLSFFFFTMTTTGIIFNNVKPVKLL